MMFCKRVQPVVARRIGDEQCVRVQHLHKARLPAARRSVHAVHAASGHHHKGRQANEARGMRIELRQLLGGGAFAHRVVQGAQLIG
jgi:hypothetical protein